MSDLSSFGAAAKGLARNPLGIIALFIVLIYGFAAMTLGFNDRLEVTERVPLVWFLVIFPVIVLLLFGWLVSCHHEKLYSPSDFRSDEIFLKKTIINQRRNEEFLADNEDLRKRIRQTVEDLLKAESEPGEFAERVTKAVEDATTLTIDASAFLDQKDAVFSFPIAAFETLGDLTDMVYFKLSSKVRPYQYGSVWILRNKETGEVIRTLRMLLGAPEGKAIRDVRYLREVGIHAGATLIVEPPQR